MLGAICGGMGVTVKEGIKKVDQKSIGSLDVTGQAALRAADDGYRAPALLGKVRRLLRQRADAQVLLRLPGRRRDGRRPGEDRQDWSTATSLEIVLLRMKRHLTASSFTTLVIPLHIAMCRPDHLHHRDHDHLFNDDLETLQLDGHVRHHRHRRRFGRLHGLQPVPNVDTSTCWRSTRS